MKLSIPQIDALCAAFFAFGLHRFRRGWAAKKEGEFYAALTVDVLIRKGLVRVVRAGNRLPKAVLTSEGLVLFEAHRKNSCFLRRPSSYALPPGFLSGSPS